MAACCVASIDAFRESNGSLPIETEALHDSTDLLARSETRRVSDFEFSDVRGREEQTESYRKSIENRVDDQRQLLFDSKTSEWFYDSWSSLPIVLHVPARGKVC